MRPLHPVLALALALALGAAASSPAAAHPSKGARTIRATKSRDGCVVCITPVPQRQRRSKLARNKPAPLEPRNRGALATLEGIQVGKRYPLVNPTTGRLDRTAHVIETGTERFSHIPFARVRFSNGHVARYAAERLQLHGRPWAEQRRYLREQRALIRRAIEAELGASTAGVQLVSLRGRHVAPREGATKARRNLGPFLTAFGEDLGPNEGLLGFEIDLKARVSRHFAAFDISTPTHEILHGMSEQFAAQFMDADLSHVMEGITDYFAFRVVERHFGVRPLPSDSYLEYQRFAKKVAAKIGDDALKRIFFGKGSNLVERLAREVDRAVGEPGRFLREARKLQRDEPASLE